MRDLAARVHASAHLTGTFRLRSGATSEEYFDKYRFEAEPVLLRDVAAALVPLVPAGTDVLAGLELGGVPIATVLSHVTGIPARFVRKRAKAYGTEQLAEGGPVEGRRVVLVEDVITSGGQVLESASALRALGATVEDVLCVIDRQAGGAEALRRSGLRLRAVLTADDLRAAAA